MLIIPLNLDSVLLLLHNSKLAYSSGAHPPRATAGHLLAHVGSPGGGALANFIAARGLGISIPRGDPPAFDIRVWVYREG